MKAAPLFVKYGVSRGVWVRMNHEERATATDGQWPRETGMNITKTYAKTPQTCGANRCKAAPTHRVLSDCWDTLKPGDFVPLCARHLADAEAEFQPSGVPGAVLALGDEEAAEETTALVVTGGGGASETTELARAEAAEAIEARDMVAVFVIETQDDLDFAAEALAEVKGKFKELKQKQDEITKPMREAQANVRELFRPALDAYATTEARLKAIILEAHAREEADRAEAQKLAADGDTKGALDKLRHTSNVDTLSTRKKLVIDVVDEDKVPISFLSADMKKIKAWFAEDKTRADAGDYGDWGLNVRYENTLASKSS